MTNQNEDYIWALDILRNNVIPQLESQIVSGGPISEVDHFLPNPKSDGINPFRGGKIYPGVSEETVSMLEILYRWASIDPNKIDWEYVILEGVRKGEFLVTDFAEAGEEFLTITPWESKDFSRIDLTPEDIKIYATEGSRLYIGYPNDDPSLFLQVRYLCQQRSEGIRLQREALREKIKEENSKISNAGDERIALEDIP